MEYINLPNRVIMEHWLRLFCTDLGFVSRIHNIRATYSLQNFDK